MSTEDLIQVAYHEAGHAAVALSKGLPFEQITIVADSERESLGNFVSSCVLAYEADTRKERRAIARNIILLCYAGFQAERLAFPLADEEQSKGDYEGAFDLSREFGVLPRSCLFIGDDNHLNYLNKLKLESLRLVQQRWYIIEKIVPALISKKILEYNAVLELIK